jgi:hypothetical protein
MKLRASSFDAARAAAILCVVGCSTTGPIEPGAGGSAGAATAGGTAGQSSGGTGTGVGGSSGAGTAGASTGAAGATNVDCAAYSGTPIQATFCNFKWVMISINPQCGGAAPCHGVGGGGINPLEMPMHDDGALMRVLESTVSPDCGNIPIITPGDPSKSAMVKVLAGPCSTTVPQMPYGCDPSSNNCVPADYQKAISDWIAAGAKLQ